MQPWSGISLTAVADDGNVIQLFPPYMGNGAVSLYSAFTPGQTIRRPDAGLLHSVQVKTDGTNAGTIEIWDVNGEDAGLDVSTTAQPVITDTQLDALVVRGLARLIYRQDVVASGITPPSGPYRQFGRGLAARFTNSGPTGACELNLVVEGGAWIKS